MVTIAVYLHLYVTVLLQQGEYLLQFGGFRGGDGVFVEAEIDDGEGCERIGRFGCHGGIGCIRNCGCIWNSCSIRNNNCIGRLHGYRLLYCCFFHSFLLSFFRYQCRGNAFCECGSFGFLRPLAKQVADAHSTVPYIVAAVYVSRHIVNAPSGEEGHAGIDSRQEVLANGSRHLQPSSDSKVPAFAALDVERVVADGSDVRLREACAETWRHFHRPRAVLGLAPQAQQVDVELQGVFLHPHVALQIAVVPTFQTECRDVVVPSVLPQPIIGNFALESRKKNGMPIIENVPIRMRVIYASQRIEFTTGYRIDVAKWDADKQRVKNGCTNKLKQSASEINADLLKYYAEKAILEKYKEVHFENHMALPVISNQKIHSEIRLTKHPCRKKNIHL